MVRRVRAQYGWAKRRVERWRRRYGDLPAAYIRSMSAALSHPGRFDTVRTYCTFIGNPRSGTTLVGSLLDAHPDTVISHELNALRFMHHRFTRRQVYELILANEVEFTRAGRSQFGYEYGVEGGWHGRYRDLLVMGDKRADGTARYLKRHPELLDKLMRTYPDPHFVHVVRNPFDNIVTLSKRRGLSLEDAARRYFKVCSLVTSVVERVGRERILDVRLEAMIEDPRRELTRLFDFLGIEVGDEQLASSQKAVFSRAKTTRSEGDWTTPLIASVEADIERFGFLSGYGFDR